MADFGKFIWDKKRNKTKEIRILDVVINALPCPFCGSLNLSFEYETSHGHGDCGFSNARIQCNSCSGAKGDAFDYGIPSTQDVIKAWKQWNERITN